MSILATKLRAIHPAMARLAALSALDPVDMAALETAIGREERRIGARREVLLEGQPVQEPLLMLSGWACRVRLLSDGRRQIFGFVLPGDLLGMCQHSRPLATATVIAITDITLCAAPHAPAAPAGAGLAEAYAVSRALDNFYLLNQIVRLGRLAAYERVADLMLELLDRLTMAGLASDGQLPLPLTQEVLADALGLTSVHVNRTLQSLRRDNVLTVRGGNATLHDPARLAERIDYRPGRISSGPAL